MNLERLKQFKHEGQNILVCNFSDCGRDERAQLFETLLKALSESAEGSVRLLVEVGGLEHDAVRANEWKKQIDLFNSRVLRTAITGLSPLNRMALSGVRMFAKLMGKDKAVQNVQVFDTRHDALDYLAS
jgi:hypothetical protein